MKEPIWPLLFLKSLLIAFRGAVEKRGVNYHLAVRRVLRDVLVWPCKLPGARQPVHVKWHSVSTTLYIETTFQCVQTGIIRNGDSSGTGTTKPYSNAHPSRSRKNPFKCYQPPSSSLDIPLTLNSVKLRNLISKHFSIVKKKYLAENIVEPLSDVLVRKIILANVFNREKPPGPLAENRNEDVL